LHLVGRRPVCFDDDGVETAVAEKHLGELVAQPIKLVGAVRRLANEHETDARVDKLERALKIARRAG